MCANSSWIPYITTAANSATLASTLALYPSQVSLMAQLQSYTNLSFLATTLTNYVRTSVLTANLTNYVTNSALTSTLANYVTTASQTTTLNSYVTVSTFSTQVNAVATQANVTQMQLTALGGVAVASYRSDFRSPPKTGWRYGYNGAIGNVGQPPSTASFTPFIFGCEYF